MERATIEILQDVGYQGPMIDESRLLKAIEVGPASADFTELVAWLSQELKSLCSLDEHVSPITNPEDAEHFLMETSGFLKELGCPYSDLVEGPIIERLKTKASRNALLTYLLSELQAAKMIEANTPERNRPATQPVMTSPQEDLKKLMLALRFSKPPENISTAVLFTNVEKRLAETLQKSHSDLVGKAIFDKKLSAEQWKAIANEQKKMHNEFRIRRELLLTRLHVTAHSFQWPEKLKNKLDDMTNAFQERQRTLTKEPAVDISDLLAARLDILVLEKTSNSSVRKNTKSALNNVVIKKVPDRGGRPSEQAAPPKEMPSWQNKRIADAPRGGGGRGGGGGGYNNQRVQGNQGGYRGGGGGQDSGGYNQHDDRDRQTYKGGSGGRVQGGWSQKGSDTDRAFNNRGRGRGFRGGNRGGFRGGREQYQ
ncbi:Hypothetical predicted protein [Cloeon dipterum]|uniref:Protein FAM98A n=1 Tax=Cloeon dipterum TaxID=197152 RepID=A0A8S1D002_9INSE|nr:Hypothetical predicted protein [Cloeon dipterum]